MDEITGSIDDSIRQLHIRLESEFYRELNDSITRAQVVSYVDEYIMNTFPLCKSGDFAVICDETNNPPGTIDQNLLKVDIFLDAIPNIDNILYFPIIIGNTKEPSFKTETDSYLYRIGV